MKTSPVKLCVKYTFYGNASRNEITRSFLRERKTQSKIFCKEKFCAFLSFILVVNTNIFLFLDKYCDFLKNKYILVETSLGFFCLGLNKNANEVKMGFSLRER